MKSKYKAVAIVVIVLSMLTVALRGAAPKTYEQTEIPVSEIQTRIVSYNLPTGWESSTYSVALGVGDWAKYDSHISSSLTNSNGLLVLTDEFSNDQEREYTRLYQNLSVDISRLPIFCINISVSEGAVYHVRFRGVDAAGNEKAVWWETSPLDDLPGKGKWELHVVDMASFGQQATSENITEIIRIEVILDKISLVNGGEKQLRVSSITFSPRALAVSEVPEGGTLVSGTEAFQAVIMDIPSRYMPDGTWDLQEVVVTYSLTANVSSGYRMYVLSAANGLLIDGPSVFSHEASFVDIYKIEALLGTSETFSEQQSFLSSSSLFGNYSIVILKDDWGQSGFQTFRLDSVEVTSLKRIGGG